ncbi:AAA family ATPase [Pseudomonas sp. C1C7]|uniref:AAA family ATPase n=1 Tax=Pseudomonas sp. C1C7 TaxID=2735272 RepID=UPI001586B561|nr:AAA family ATPase [Pseudomonas sp. C1C7]NUT73738.1 AAA family ATPase [Pseudomonas sp. C1C7]
MWATTVTESASNPSTEKTINIFPVNTGWNDFGYNFHAQARFLASGVVHEANIRLVPFPSDQPESNISAWVKRLIGIHKKELPGFPPNIKFPPFVCVLSSVDEYKRLAEVLAPDAYDEVLLSLGELNSLLINEKISNDTYRLVVDTPQFANGVIRKSGPYKAFKYGYFKGNRVQPPIDARIPFSFTTKPREASTYTVNFTYRDNDLIPDRVHCLIGVNGVGKTRYLKNLILAVQEKVNSVSESRIPSQLFEQDGGLAVPDENECSENWSDLPSFSRVCVYSTDPHNILPRRANLRGAFDYLYFDMGLEEKSGLAHQLADLIRSEDRLGSEERFVLFKKIMQKAVPDAQLLIPVHNKLQDSAKMFDELGNAWIPLAAVRGNELRVLDILNNINETRDLAFRTEARLAIPLSSGQKMFFRFATHFLSVADQGTLVLIDEPETHLHPNLITEFMNLLYEVLVATSSVAVVATHSVYVVRETPSHCVHVFRKKQDSTVAIDQFYIKTLGASVSELSETIFGDSLVESFNDKIVNQIVERKISLEDIIKRYSDILSMDMLIKVKHHLKSKES